MGPDKTTQSHAVAQFVRSQSVLEDLASKSSQFQTAAEHLRHEFSLFYNYGMGSVVLAKETAGKFEWLVSRDEA